MRTTILIWRLYWIKFNVPWTINWAISWNSNMTPIYRENVYLCWKIEFNHILHLLVGNISGEFAVKSNSTSAQKLQIGEVHLECAFFQSSISKCPPAQKNHETRRCTLGWDLSGYFLWKEMAVQWNVYQIQLQRLQKCMEIAFAGEFLKALLEIGFYCIFAWLTILAAFIFFALNKTSFFVSLFGICVCSSNLTRHQINLKSCFIV